MDNPPVHEIELYPPEKFKTLLNYEVNQSHRYGDSLTLVCLIVETDRTDVLSQHQAELTAIHALNVHLREADIPCKQGNEFLVLMPATSPQGARTACERVRKFIIGSHQAEGKTPFSLSIYSGMAALPNDDTSVTAEKLLQHAQQALQYARDNHSTSVISFSDLL
jgi:hypothetical protein